MLAICCHRRWLRPLGTWQRIVIALLPTRYRTHRAASYLLCPSFRLEKPSFGCYFPPVTPVIYGRFTSHSSRPQNQHCLRRLLTYCFFRRKLMPAKPPKRTTPMLLSKSMTLQRDNLQLLPKAQITQRCTLYSTVALLPRLING